MDKQNKKLFFITLICSIVFSSIVAGAVGFWAGSLSQKTDELNLLQDRNIVKVNEESDIVSVVEKVSPAVVSIIITKNLPKIEEYYFNPFEMTISLIAFSAMTFLILEFHNIDKTVLKSKRLEVVLGLLLPLTDILLPINTW